MCCLKNAKHSQETLSPAYNDIIKSRLQQCRSREYLLWCISCSCVHTSTDKLFCGVFAFTVMRVNHSWLVGWMFTLLCSVYPHLSFMLNSTLDFLCVLRPLYPSSPSCHMFEILQVLLLHFPRRRRNYRKTQRRMLFFVLVFCLIQLTAWFKFSFHGEFFISTAFSAHYSVLYSVLLVTHCSKIYHRI